VDTEVCQFDTKLAALEALESPQLTPKKNVQNISDYSLADFTHAGLNSSHGSRVQQRRRSGDAKG
jgi:hypothetical protein